MNLAASRARRVIARLTLACALAGCGVVAYAQNAPPALPAGYQDHYIADGTLSPDVSSSDGADTSGGLARAMRIDAVASVLQQEGTNAPSTREDGLILDAQWDTISYGAWSADAAARTGGSSRTAFGDDYGEGSFSLHQRGMPFDDGWVVDNALGDISAPLIDLARNQPRFILGQGPMEGVDTEWHGPAGVELLAGAGEPGIYGGIKVPTFQTLGGSTATLGAQWTPAPQWSIGGELASAHDTSFYYQPIGSGFASTVSEQLTATTGFLTAAWQGNGEHAQLNLIDGTLNGAGNALGVWLDTSRTSGAITQSLGAFRIDPNLAWGNQLVTNDVQGGYYRIDYQTRRWFADFGVDQVSSVSGDGTEITFVNADARYQLSRDTGIGGVVNVRHSEDSAGNSLDSTDNAWSAEGYLDRVNSLGIGRAQLDYARDTQTRESTVTLQQTWKVVTGTRLSTSAAVDRVQSTTAGLIQDSTVLRLAVYGGGDLSARLSVDGSVQWAQAVQGAAAPARSADVSLTYQVAKTWSVLASYYENRVGSWTPLVVTSPLAPPTPAAVPAAGERGIFLTVRYQDARGGHFVPLGGAPGSGSGRLSGVVYLDANENGRYDAGELGVANVTVLLDGRFSTRTDASGRYDFPAVAAGHHVLTVQSDNLPLPWMLTNAGRTEVDVSTRDRTVVDIGAVRLK